LQFNRKLPLAYSQILPNVFCLAITQGNNFCPVVLRQVFQDRTKGSGRAGIAPYGGYMNLLRHAHSPKNIMKANLSSFGTLRQATRPK
jgi:hypothetical protein